jgi:hypothetical protein
MASCRRPPSHVNKGRKARRKTYEELDPTQNLTQMPGKSLHLCLLPIVAILMINASPKGSDHKYLEGVMLDAAEYDWCHHDCAPFDRPTFFFCVQVSDQILVGSHKADWVWMYDSWQMSRFKGKPVSVRFDSQSIWIVRTDGKDMHLDRDYSQDLYTPDECTAEVHRHWLAQFANIKRPETVPAEAVLVPQGLRPIFKSVAPHFWVKCAFDPQKNQDACDRWDEKGHKYQKLECVNTSDQSPVQQIDLVIDPLTTKTDYELHLKNGIILTARTNR